MELNEAWGILEEFGVSEQTLQIITDINGYSMETLEDVLYVISGYRNFDQVLEED